MAIRYNESLNGALQKAVKNYNAKITRLSRMDANLLPNRASVREMKRTITDRRELLREIAKLKRFTTRGAENLVTTEAGLTFTNYALNEMKREQALARRLATIKVNQQIKRLGTTSVRYPVLQNSALNTLKAQANILKKYDVTNIRGADYKRHMARIEQQLRQKRRNQTFYNNFFDILLQQCELAGYDSDKLAEIENTLRDLSPNELLEFANNDPSVSAIMYNYSKGDKMTVDDEEETIVFADYLYNNKDRILNDYKS